MRLSALLLVMSACGSVETDPLAGGLPGDARMKADADGDGSDSSVDCNDGNAAVYPGATEACNSIDDNCNGRIDEAGATGSVTWYRDQDADTYGRSDRARSACTRPAGYARRGGDCDDTNAAVGPPTFGSDCAAPYGACDATANLLLVPGDHASIQEAIGAAAEGDEVCVGPGTWTELLDFGGKGIRVVGALGAASTVIDGGGAGPILSMTSAEPSSAGLSGLTLTNGHAVDGGAIYLYDLGSSPTFTDLDIHDNAADDDGGGIYGHGTAPMLSGLDLRDNTAGDSGGAVRLVYAANNVIEDTVMSGNYAGGSGGGLICRECITDLHGVTIEDNYAVSAGGGIESYKSTLVMIDVSILNNGTGVAGGGYASFEEDNTQGERVTIRGNVAGEKGGGFFISAPQSAAISSLLITDNEAPSGGGIAFDYDCTYYLRNVTVVGNRATNGAGIAMLGKCTDTTHPGPVRMQSGIVANNVGSSSGGIYATGSARIRASYSLVYGNGVNWSGMSTQIGTRGNVAADPTFRTWSADLDPTRWDLHLRSGSPAINTGDPTASDPDGTRADMGMYGGDYAGDGYTGWYLDSDGDGMPDAWEEAHGLDPATSDGLADADADGLSNADELTAGTWPEIADTDDDGVSDGAEVSAGEDPLDPGA